MHLIPKGKRSFFDNFFDDMLPSFNSRELMDSEFFSPSIDIEERDDHYLVTADLPGVSKDDIEITLDHGVLTLQAQRSDETEEKKKGKVIRRERRSGSFMRSFNVGSSATEADINAQFKDGVLTLTVPRMTDEPPTVRRIKVQ